MQAFNDALASLDPEASVDVAALQEVFLRRITTSETSIKNTGSYRLSDTLDYEFNVWLFNTWNDLRPRVEPIAKTGDFAVELSKLLAEEKSRILSRAILQIQFIRWCQAALQGGRSLTADELKVRRDNIRDTLATRYSNMLTTYDYPSRVAALQDLSSKSLSTLRGALPAPLPPLGKVPAAKPAPPPAPTPPPASPKAAPAPPPAKPVPPLSLAGSTASLPTVTPPLTPRSTNTEVDRITNAALGKMLLDASVAESATAAFNEFQKWKPIPNPQENEDGVLTNLKLYGRGVELANQYKAVNPSLSAAVEADIESVFDDGFDRGLDSDQAKKKFYDAFDKSLQNEIAHRLARMHFFNAINFDTLVKQFKQLEAKLEKLKNDAGSDSQYENAIEKLGQLFDSLDTDNLFSGQYYEWITARLGANELTQDTLNTKSVIAEIDSAVRTPISTCLQIEASIKELTSQIIQKKPPSLFAKALLYANARNWFSWTSKTESARTQFEEVTNTDASATLKNAGIDSLRYQKKQASTSEPLYLPLTQQGAKVFVRDIYVSTKDEDFAKLRDTVLEPMAPELARWWLTSGQLRKFNATEQKLSDLKGILRSDKKGNDLPSVKDMEMFIPTLEKTLGWIYHVLPRSAIAKEGYEKWTYDANFTSNHHRKPTSGLTPGGDAKKFLYVATAPDSILPVAVAVFQPYVPDPKPASAVSWTVELPAVVVGPTFNAKRLMPSSSTAYELLSFHYASELEEATAGEVLKRLLSQLARDETASFPLTILWKLPQYQPYQIPNSSKLFGWLEKNLFANLVKYDKKPLTPKELYNVDLALALVPKLDSFKTLARAANLNVNPPSIVFFNESKKPVASKSKFTETSDIDLSSRGHPDYYDAQVFATMQALSAEKLIASPAFETDDDSGGDDIDDELQAYVTKGNVAEDSDYSAFDRIRALLSSGNKN